MMYLQHIGVNDETEAEFILNLVLDTAQTVSAPISPLSDYPETQPTKVEMKQH